MTAHQTEMIYCNFMYICPFLGISTDETLNHLMEIQTGVLNVNTITEDMQTRHKNYHLKIRTEMEEKLITFKSTDNEKVKSICG